MLIAIPESHFTREILFSFTSIQASGKIHVIEGELARGARPLHPLVEITGANDDRTEQQSRTVFSTLHGIDSTRVAPHRVHSDLKRREA